MAQYFIDRKCEAENCDSRGNRPLKNWEGTALNWYCEEHLKVYWLRRNAKLEAFIQLNRDIEKRKTLSERHLKLYKLYTEEKS